MSYDIIKIGIEPVDVEFFSGIGKQHIINLIPESFSYVPINAREFRYNFIYFDDKPIDVISGVNRKILNIDNMKIFNAPTVFKTPYNVKLTSGIDISVYNTSGFLTGYLTLYDMNIEIITNAGAFRSKNKTTQLKPDIKDFTFDWNSFNPNNAFYVKDVIFIKSIKLFFKTKDHIAIKLRVRGSPVFEFTNTVDFKTILNQPDTNLIEYKFYNNKYVSDTSLTAYESPKTYTSLIPCDVYNLYGLFYRVSFNNNIIFQPPVETKGLKFTDIKLFIYDLKDIKTLVATVIGTANDASNKFYVTFPDITIINRYFLAFKLEFKYSFKNKGSLFKLFTFSFKDFKITFT
jgi:hypothetical protein